jgi:hypothetical protein
MFDLSEYDINATELNLSKKNITGLLNLSQFTKLQNLNCCHNSITKLILGNSLTELICCHNSITKLILGNSLTHLFCYNNRIKKLNLPNSLTHLFCYNNQIKELNLPNSLIILYCYNNQIKELNLPNSLIFLNCDKIYDFECTIKNINTYNKLKLNVSNKSSKKITQFFKKIIYFKKIKQYYHPDNIALLCDDDGVLNESLLKY